QRTCGSVHAREIHQAQIRPVSLLATDALVVIQEVAAAIEDQPIPVDFHALDVMGRMAMNDVHTGPVDQAVGEVDLLLRDAKTPVASPMDREDHDVPFTGMTYDRGCDFLHGLVGEIREEVDAWPLP